LSNDVGALGVGHAQYHVMCNERGGAVDDLFVYHVAEEAYLVVVNAANHVKDFSWMVAHNPISDGATFTDVSNAWSLLAVQGPDAERTLQPLVEADLSSVESRGLVGAVVAGVPGCVVARTGYTGEDGFEVFAPAESVRPLWGAILEAGASFDILPCGLGARDTLRLEVRNPLYGHELTDETSPFQAGLGFAVALDKPGGFLGADALRRRKGNEPERLVGIVLEGKRIARDGMDVLHEGKVVGKVTSGTRSPSLGKGICLAYVRRDLARPGTRLVVDVRGREASGEVIRGPFYIRPQKEKR
ncbi:MAG: glycine cleavage system aminomethyltransferase GcvT, partial [Deltaproteobacteria bacterium]|nr:glycine cleavage system aminomethyltransferase GcvT [Deltaproteobacteria bacterium]